MCHGQHVWLVERVADGEAHGFQEGVAQTAAHHEVIDLGDEVLEDVDLRGDLRTADDGREGALLTVEGLFEVHHLVVKQVAGEGLAREATGHGGRGGVLAVRGAEGVVHIDIAQACQRLGEIDIALLLFLVEAQVLHQHNTAGSEVLAEGFSLGGQHVAAEDNLLAEDLGHRLHDVTQGKLVLRLAFRTAEVGEQDGGTAVGQNLADGLFRAHDAGDIGHVELLVQRHVVVNADQGSFAAEIMFLNGFHNAWYFGE